MRNTLIALAICTLPMIAIAGYSPTQVGWVGRLNDTSTIALTLDAWSDIDAFSDTGFLPLDPGITASPDGRGIVIAWQGRYEIYIYGNFKKTAGANPVNLEFCLTVNGVCAGNPLKVTAENAVNYIVDVAIVDLAAIIPGATYGLAVRNTTNGDDLIMEYAYLRARRL